MKWGEVYVVPHILERERCRRKRNQFLSPFRWILLHEQSHFKCEAESDVSLWPFLHSRMSNVHLGTNSLLCSSTSSTLCSMRSIRTNCKRRVGSFVVINIVMRSRHEPVGRWVDKMKCKERAAKGKEPTREEKEKKRNFLLSAYCDDMKN